MSLIAVASLVFGVFVPVPWPLYYRPIPVSSSPTSSSISPFAPGPFEIDGWFARLGWWCDLFDVAGSMHVPDNVVDLPNVAFALEVLSDLANRNRFALPFT